MGVPLTEIVMVPELVAAVPSYVPRIQTIEFSTGTRLIVAEEPLDDCPPAYETEFNAMFGVVTAPILMC